MSETFDSLIAKGRPYLAEYLEMHGVEFNKRGKFRCIEPDHEDQDPSAGIVPETNGEWFHCFGCGCSGDIFTAAYCLEGKPLLGPGFIAENVEHILDTFNVEHEKVELTKEQVNKMRFMKVHDAVTRTMLEKGEDGEFVHLDLKCAAERGWTAATCEELCVGTIRDFKKFSDSVQKKTSLTKLALEDMDITKELFGPKRLTFTIRDHTGIVVGFVARYIPWKKGSSVPKYSNTSEFKNPLYNKGRILYGLSAARKFTGLRHDIFEGYSDYVTAFQAGYKNCSAMGGTAFTQDHADLLYDLGFRHINLIYDSDTTGKNVSRANIERFSGYQGLKVTIMHLPLTEEEMESEEGHNDPDYFIKTYGIDKYRKVRTIGAFEHKISQTEFAMGSEEAVCFAKETARLIINEENRIERGRMVKALAAHTGVDRTDIEAEVERMEGSQLTRIRNDLQKQLRTCRSPDALGAALDAAQASLLETSATKETRYLLSVAESVASFEGIFEEMQNQTPGIHGWLTGYQPLDEMMDGIAKPGKGGGVAYGIAGAPQHGKSAALLNIALRVAQKNDDVSVLYWAIDDSRKAIAYRLVSLMSNVSMKKVRKMYAPNEEEAEAIAKAQRDLLRLCSEGRLVFKDDSFGRSRKKTETWIRSMQDLHERDVFLCVDSLHNIAGDSDMRVKLVESSGWVKSLCTRIPISAMATLEVIKNRGSEKPSLTAISESGKMEFDFDAVAVAWNETQGRYGDLDLVQAKWGEPGDYKPIIELDWQKNKSAAGEKGSIYFKFDPRTTAFLESSRKVEGLEISRPIISDMGKESSVTIENQKDRSRTLVRSRPSVELRTSS
jgi:DNA primase catalytic core